VSKPVIQRCTVWDHARKGVVGLAMTAYINMSGDFKMETIRKLAVCGLTSFLAALVFSSAALAEVEITAKAKNVAGDKIKVMVSGESVNGGETGRPPGLTGMARRTCAAGDKGTVAIVGSFPLTSAGGIEGCPIALFYNGLSNRITINLCDTPPTIGGDFAGLSCAGLVQVFGENAGDKVKAKLKVN